MGEVTVVQCAPHGYRVTINSFAFYLNDVRGGQKEAEELVRVLLVPLKDGLSAIQHLYGDYGSTVLQDA